jgi:hypothetical protein
MTERHIQALLTPEQKKKYLPIRERFFLDDEVIPMMEIMAMTYSPAFGFVFAGVSLTSHF